MYFVLDRSGSMGVDNKWATVRTAVANITRSLGPRANFGASLFPGSNTQACGAAREVLSVSPGDPLGTKNGPTTTKLLTATQLAPRGGTPTAEALRSTLKALLARQKAPNTNAGDKTFIILATDGAPNCNGETTCTTQQCPPNIESIDRCTPTGFNCCEPPQGGPEMCLDTDETIAATQALASAGFPVYVIGLPGTDAYARVLDDLASAGGTALPNAPRYYRIATTSDSASLLAALKRISAKIVATCNFQLKEPPARPDLVNVYVDDVVLPADPINGWKIEEQTVTLVGKACERALAGDTLGVRIIAGCPTVTPR